MLIQDIAYLKAKLVIIYFFKLVKESIRSRSHPVKVATEQRETGQCSSKKKKEVWA